VQFSQNDLYIGTEEVIIFYGSNFSIGCPLAGKNLLRQSVGVNYTRTSCVLDRFYVGVVTMSRHLFVTYDLTFKVWYSIVRWLGWEFVMS
jgi:hypothetical protein